MADYRALAQALDPYAVDSGAITPDSFKALQNIRSPNLLGMISEIGRGGLSNLESLVRGGVAQFAGTPVDTLNTIRTPYPMEVMGDVNYAPDKQVYGGTKDILGMLPQRVTQARPETAGMEELGTIMGPGLAKGAAPVAKGYLSLLGNEINAGLTGQSTRSVIGQITPKPLMAVEINAKNINALPSDYYELNGMATQAYTDLRAKPSQETADYYKAIMKARDEAPNNPSNNYKSPVPDIEPQGYKGQHAAPTKDGGAPLWDMKGIYPDDFYSPQGAQYYGDGADKMRDSMIVRQMQSMKNRPNAPVTIYRAVPKSVSTKEALNTGDWITLDRQYAKEHGEGALNGDYKIVSKTVKARDLFTNGDSIYEMGYDPQPRILKTK
jgi:hypothetical protein